MYAQFPRGLRDMVYAYMTLEKVNICNLVELSAKDWLTRILPVLLKVIKAGYTLILSIDEFGSTRAAQYIELKTQRPLSVARITMLDALQAFDRRMWNAYTETLDKWMEKPKIEIGREVCATDRLTITRSSETMRCL